MFRRRIFSAAIAVSLSAAPAAAQSLGDLARQEEGRRAATRSVKALTNSDLRPQDITNPTVPGAPGAPVDCYMSKSKGQCVSAEDLVSNSVAGGLTKENAPFEQKWRDDAEEIRSQIEQTHDSIATLEAVIADAGRSPSDRKGAEKALASARQALAGLERRWKKLEIAAGNQRIPRKWLEPIPTLTTKTPQ